nr:phospholipase-like protein [Tanacetum cinerariifolium]
MTLIGTCNTSVQVIKTVSEGKDGLTASVHSQIAKSAVKECLTFQSQTWKSKDLLRPFKRINRIYLGRDLEQWLSRSDVDCCKFPWCNDISVDSSFWRGLCGLDDHRKGWLLDELNMRECLAAKIPIILKETGVFEKKIIDPVKYNISFRHADHVPKQGGVFGDCGVFMCMFLYRLAHSVPLAVDDPVQVALAYHFIKYLNYVWCLDASMGNGICCG